VKPQLVVENDPHNVAKERARHWVADPLKELAANLMRVARGAGKPYDIGSNCVEVLKGFERARCARHSANSGRGLWRAQRA
jgi:hypothetical protein